MKNASKSEVSRERQKGHGSKTGNTLRTAIGEKALTSKGDLR